MITMHVYIVNVMVTLQLFTDEYDICLFKYLPHLLVGIQSCYHVVFSIGWGGVAALFLQLKFILPQLIVQLHLIIFISFSGVETFQSTLDSLHHLSLYIPSLNIG